MGSASPLPYQASDKKMVILEEETYKRFGYFSTEWAPHSKKRIIAKCDDCGIMRETSKDAYRDLCRPCSQKGERHPLFGKSRSEETRKKMSISLKGKNCGKNNPSWTGGKIKRICLECGKEFFVKSYIVKRGDGKYCSHSCTAKARKNNNNSNWQGGSIKCICENCGGIFFTKRSRVKKGWGKYCSRACSAKGNLGKMIGEKSPRWKGGPIAQTCQVCGKSFNARRCIIEEGKGRYCSTSCAAKARRHNAKPKKTQPECIFENICKTYDLPFHFVGDGTLWLGNANPDFIHNTRKLICEIFGDYFHSPLLNSNLRYTATLEGRRKQLKAEGYKLIVLWESDLKRPDAEAFVLHELKKFKISSTQ